MLTGQAPSVALAVQVQSVAASGHSKCKESAGGGSNPGGLTEQEQANGEAFDNTVESMGGYYDPSTGATWVP